MQRRQQPEVPAVAHLGGEPGEFPRLTGVEAPVEVVGEDGEGLVGGGHLGRRGLLADSETGEHAFAVLLFQQG